MNRSKIPFRTVTRTAIDARLSVPTDAKRVLIANELAQF